MREPRRPRCDRDEDSHIIESVDSMSVQKISASNGMLVSEKPISADYTPGLLKGADTAEVQWGGDVSKVAASRCRLAICVAAAYLAMMSVGLMCAYSSPALPDIRKRFNLTNDEVSWFGSLVLPGAVLGGLIEGQLVNLIGPPEDHGHSRPVVRVWLAVYHPGPIDAMADVSPARMRGLLNTGCNLLFSVGILLGYVMGKWLHYTWLAVACLAPAFVCGVAFAFYVQESPRWLILKGRRVQALEALKFYQGPHQAAAVNVVLFYAKDIFDEAGTSLESHNCSIIMGAISVVTFAVATVLADRTGRKKLIIVSAVITMIGLGLLGLYFHSKSMHGEEFSKENGWFPVLAIALYAVGHSLGLGPLPFVIMGGAYPAKG
ncbi:hypothetical protein MRX96_045111 [Rhipicephalus microplus]